MTVAQIQIAEAEINDLCRRNGIRKLALFGPVLTSRFSVLVEFRPQERLGFFRLTDVEAELSRLLGGRKVDVRTPMDLSRYFRDEVVQGALVLYTEPRCGAASPHAGGCNEGVGSTRFFLRWTKRLP